MALNLNEDINNSPFACEKGLDGSNNRYRVLFDAIGDGVFLYGFNEGQNPYTNFIEVNAAACKQSGYTRNELLKLSPFDLMTMPKGDDFQKGKAKYVNDNEFVFESTLVRKDGSTFPVEINSHLFLFESQRTCLAIVRDITERKNAKTISVKLATIMDMLPDIVYIKDNAGVYQTVNRAFEQFIGRASGDIVGKTDRELLPPDLAQQCSAADKVLIESGRSLRSEEKQCADGKERYYDTIKVPLFDENGIPAGIVGVSRDITESKKMAEALKSSREHLSLATELAHLGPWKYHPETNLFEFGEEFYAIYGTTVEREGAFMTPETYAREFLLPDDAWLVAEEVKKACSSTTSRYAARVQHRIIRRDGEVRVISVLINIERDASGNVLAWYGTNQDITEWVNAEEALRQKTEENERIAYTDALTGLPNRAGLMKRLEEEIIKVRLNGVPGAVLFIDLDELKMVNDAFGHSYGDALIRVAGSRIAEKAGKNSLVGRIGGDEFIVVLHGIRDRAEIGRVANDIVLDLGDDIEALGIRFHVSASVGIACYPEDGNTAEEVFKNADIAMYAAKRSGKNCWRFYEKEMQIEAFNKMLLANSLRHALERRELSLHYQPIVDITSKGIIGFEALLRWKSPEYGSVPPKRFISLAEQNGMIHPIGEWVLMEACQFVRRLVDAGRKDIYVTVNVSAYQLCAEGFVDSIRCALNNAGIEPCQLELEITENALIASLEEGTRTCQELRAIGVRLALDDFGTGYSSLTYLQRLPVNTLKIDKSFIDQMLTGKPIIKNIVDMAHTMDIKVVAEGVETQQQLDFLAQIDCDYFQGYIVTPPVPEAKAVNFLR